MHFISLLKHRSCASKRLNRHHIASWYSLHTHLGHHEGGPERMTLAHSQMQSSSVGYREEAQLCSTPLPSSVAAAISLSPCLTSLLRNELSFPMQNLTPTTFSLMPKLAYIVPCGRRHSASHHQCATNKIATTT